MPFLLWIPRVPRHDHSTAYKRWGRVAWFPSLIPLTSELLSGRLRGFLRLQGVFRTLWTSRRCFRLSKIFPYLSFSLLLLESNRVERTVKRKTESGRVKKVASIDDFSKNPRAFSNSLLKPSSLSASVALKIDALPREWFADTLTSLSLSLVSLCRSSHACSLSGRTAKLSRIRIVAFLRSLIFLLLVFLWISSWLTNPLHHSF